jgi:RND family efflux transporter MFP subunit
MKSGSESSRKFKRIWIILPVMVVVAVVFGVVQSQKAKKTEKKDYSSRVPVSVALAVHQAVRDSFSVVGTVDAYRDIGIFSETGGIVRKVMAEVGQKKVAGAELIKVDDEVQASSLRKARAAYEQAKRDYERYKSLHDAGAVALSSFESVKLRLEDAEADMITARKKFHDTAVKAPIQGTITSRLVDTGEMVQPGMKVANMVDLSKLKIRVSVPEKQVVRLAEGVPVQVTSDIYAGKTFTGNISTISGKAGRDHTYEVEVVMVNPSATPFRGGMFARVAFVDGRSHDALIIPRAALTGSVREPRVFVVNKSVARAKTIVAGMELQQSLEVLGGLAPGDSVVTSGQNELSDGMAVSVTKQLKATAP